MPLVASNCLEPAARSTLLQNPASASPSSLSSPGRCYPVWQRSCLLPRRSPWTVARSPHPVTRGTAWHPLPFPRGASPCLRERRSRHCTWPKGLCGLRQRQIGEDTLPISLAEATRNSENWGLVESPHCAGSRRPPDTHTPEGGRTFVRPNAPVAANAALERFAVALSSRSVGREAD
jgi:hypothetical protein